MDTESPEAPQSSDKSNRTGLDRLLLIGIAAALVLLLGLAAATLGITVKQNSEGSESAEAAQEVVAAPAEVTVADREAILAALRTAVEIEIGQPVSFATSDVEAGGSYALVHVVVMRADGGEIDWASIPRFATAYEAGALDPISEALLKKTADAWEVVEVGIGPTDTNRDVWLSEYDIPAWSALEE